jgi:hypothetical protein
MHVLGLFPDGHPLSVQGLPAALAISTSRATIVDLDQAVYVALVGPQLGEVGSYSLAWAALYILYEFASMHKGSPVRLFDDASDRSMLSSSYSSEESCTVPNQLIYFPS